jgi:ubiquinone/menaquinone biosynthesis C-methylase UbiE
MARTPDVYTHGHHESVLRSHTWRTAANSAAYLLPHLRPGQSVLDIGCGPGTITLDLARLVAPGRVLGIDQSADVLDAPRAEAAALGLGNVELAVGDAYVLDLPDGSVDVVHAHQVLQHLSDPVAALVEMRRVCAADGVVAVRDADYAAMTWYPADPRLDRWLVLYEAVARSNSAEPDAGRRLRGWAAAAGFTDITSSAGVWCFAAPDERAWWASLWADRVTSSRFAEQALDRDLATAAELDDIAAGWRHWAEQDDAFFAVLHGEVLARP